jgi:photosystem II stability/assembly factor-like uncharacterized protein
MVGDADGAVLAAQLVTQDSGWALTTTRLAWTGDGARTWRTITPAKVPAARVRGAFFLDWRTGWMVASAKPRETGSRVQLAVYRTGDAGASWGWSSLGELDLGGDNAAGGYAGGFGVLAVPSFVDRHHGWVAVLTSSDTYEAHSFLFRTTDGGATWARLPGPPGAPRLAVSSRTSGCRSSRAAPAAPAACTGPLTPAAAGEGSPPPRRRRCGEPACGSASRRPSRASATGSCRSSSSGRREASHAPWPRASSSPPTAVPPGRPRYVPLADEDEQYGLLPQAAADRRTLLAVVGHGARKLLTSRDGGGRWALASTGLEGRYPAVRGLAFAGLGTGWAVTARSAGGLENGCQPPTPRCDDRGALLRTTDGGTSWTDATPGR